MSQICHGGEVWRCNRISGGYVKNYHRRSVEHAQIAYFDNVFALVRSAEIRSS